MKCFASRLFPLLLVGQCFDAIAQLFFYSMPPQLAANWFGASEVSTATSIGVLGNQVGIALGLVLPPLTVSSNATATIADQLRATHIVGAVITSAVVLTTALCW